LPKAEIKAAIPVATDVKLAPAPIKPATPAPSPAPEAMPAPTPVPLPTPRLPATNEVPVLPPPPSWKTSVEGSPVPTDKIVVISNLEPSSAKPEMRDLIDVTAQPKAIVPPAHAADAAPAAIPGKTLASKGEPITFGHEANFTAIAGQVQEFRKTLRLRYAAIDQNDIYGGVVTLEGSVDLSQLRDGRQVRVRGVLIPPTERNENARYRVTAVELLD
jgi:hypothetical protein